MQAPPHVERFECISATFHRGAGTADDPVRQCIGYWRVCGDGELEIFALHDPQVGIDPVRYPPAET